MATRSAVVGRFGEGAGPTLIGGGMCVKDGWYGGAGGWSKLKFAGESSMPSSLSRSSQPLFKGMKGRGWESPWSRVRLDLDRNWRIMVALNRAIMVEIPHARGYVEQKRFCSRGYDRDGPVCPQDDLRTQ